ncbi:uncharacterized protein LOC111247623 isoform X2 [Varroa destructor]|uniref:Major facilitator superfamily associated domain-containing protein n=1 Tax=Varroa destructor TaxID=109461 RepID=A0A7M7JYB4_VARDE|nr:uncharacterized protein LOC111247623 isoform X2 [Varroa destructor]XP_022654524.1 uncharacterized protein LOC111247623 isoform X2 [Varroa destructor]
MGLYEPVTSKNEEDSSVEPERFEFPSTMQYLNVAAKRRCATLFFTFHSSAEILILSFVPLVLRFIGISMFASAFLRAGSIVLAALLSSLVLTCVRSPSSRKVLAGVALLLTLVSLVSLIYSFRPMNLRFILPEVEKQANATFIRFSFPSWENDNCLAATLWPSSRKVDGASDRLPPEIATLSNIQIADATRRAKNNSEMPTFAADPVPPIPKNGVFGLQDRTVNSQNWSPLPEVSPPSEGGHRPGLDLSQIPEHSPLTYKPFRPTGPQVAVRRNPPRLLARPEWVPNVLEGTSKFPLNSVRLRHDTENVNGIQSADSKNLAGFDGDGMVASNDYDENNNNDLVRFPEFIGISPMMERARQHLPPFIPGPSVFKGIEPASQDRRFAEIRRTTRTLQDQSDQNGLGAPSVSQTDEHNISEAATNITESTSDDGTDNFWTRLNYILAPVSTLTTYLVTLTLLTFLDTGFKISSQVCDGLYRGYLGQLDYLNKIGDHLPFQYGAICFLVSVVSFVAWRFRCELLSIIGDPSEVFIFFSALPLILAFVVLSKFPVPDKKVSLLKVESVTPNRVSILNNARAFLLACTLVLLGVISGAEQSSVLWRLIDCNADFLFVICFFIIPILTSSLLIRTNGLRRPSTIGRFMLIALVTVHIRFIGYAYLTEYGKKADQLYWLLPLQILTPFGTTFVWSTIDSFVQQVSFPKDNGRLRRQFYLAYWNLGLASGTLIAGFGYDHFGFLLTFSSIGVASGIWAVIFFYLSRYMSLHRVETSSPLRYTKLPDHEEEVTLKRSINIFREADDESDTDDDTVEFDAILASGKNQASKTAPR